MPERVEVGAGQVTAGAGRRHLGHSIDVEITRFRFPQTRLNLGHVGIRFLRLRLRFVGGDSHQDAADRYLRAALHRRPDDASLHLGRHLGLFLRDQRAGDVQEARDRFLFGASGLHPDRRRLRVGRCGGLRAAVSAGRDHKGKRRGEDGGDDK